MTAPGLTHGGDPGPDARAQGWAPGDVLDLSTGIHPDPYPLPALPAWTVQRLPASDLLTDLTAAARQAYGVVGDDSGVVAAPGSQAALQLLPRLVPRAQAAVLAPSYGEHAQRWRDSGHRVVAVGGPGDVPSSAQYVVLGQPNNPDGRRFAPGDLLTLTDQLAGSGGLLVVDEAFADFEPGLSVAPYAGRPGLVVLRSLGKSYGLAGLRLGVALGQTDLMARLAHALGPWAVSTPAAWAGTRVLADAPGRSALAEQAARRRRDLDALLAAYGYAVLGGTDLFRLVEVVDGPATARAMLTAGVAVRSFAELPTAIRLGLPPDAAWAWQRLHAALAAGR